MDGRNGSKRARTEADDGLSTPNNSNNNTNNDNNDISGSTAIEPVYVEERRAIDPEFEREMDRLGIDDVLKESLREMSPNTRGEVMTDILLVEAAEQVRNVVLPPSMLSFLDLNGLQSAMRNEVLSPHVAINVVDSESAEPDETRETERTGSPSQQFHRDHPRRPVRTHLPFPRELLATMLEDPLRVFSGAVGGMEQLNEMSELLALRSLGVTGDIDDLTYEQLLELQDKIGYVNRGMRSEDVAKHLRDVPVPGEGSCVVCQCEWSEDAEAPSSVVELSWCKHVFHRACIREWLLKNKCCPVCKTEAGANNAAAAGVERRE